MGRVMAPWGVKGALKIEPFGSGSGSLCKHSAWWVGKPGKLSEVAVAECRAHGAYLVARFEGCSSPEQAAAYREAEVALRREDLPEPAAHEFYQADLIGLAVVNAQGERLGKVTGFFSAGGANDVMRVAHESGERLVPATAEVIRKVDLAAGTVEVDWGADW
jgi:16S rRNA processing protein RimM